MENGIKSTYVCGNRYFNNPEEGTQSHAWLLVDGWIVDITGDEEDYISWENLYESYRQYFFLKSKSSNVHYEILPKQAFIKSFMNKAEIGYGGKVEQVRRRKFGDNEYPNAVRRLTGIKVKI